MKLLGRTDKEVTASNFSFSGTRVAELGASEYTIVSVIVDVSGSVASYKADLEKAIANIIQSLDKSPRKENLLVQVVVFNHDISEIHGFVGLDTIDVKSYKLNPDGSTALYDATLFGLEAVQQYGEKLQDLEYLVNAVVFVVTDGAENASRIGDTNKIKKQIAAIQKAEKLESVKTILIGVGDDTSVQAYLDSFKNDAGLDQFVWVGDSKPGSLARMAEFISRSVSSSSQALGTGGPSKNLTF